MLRPYTIIIFAILSFIFSMGSQSGAGRAFGIAATAAPGETGQTCARSGCHRSGNFSPQTTVQLIDMDGNEVSAYMPGIEYTVNVKITTSNGSPGGYGFQMVALKDADNSSTDSWVESFTSGIQASDIGGKRYVEHFGTNRSSNEFSVNWTAPEIGTGAVTFYAVGLAVNRNGGTSGDSDDTGNVKITEALPSSLEKVSVGSDINVFPNPAQDFINISFNDSRPVSYQLYNIIGKMVANGNVQIANERIDLTNQKSGIYLLSLFDNEGQKLTTRKVIKK